MKKLGFVVTIIVALVVALSCFAMVAFAADITPQTITDSSSAAILSIADQNFSAIAGAAAVVLCLSAASVVVLRRK